MAPKDDEEWDLGLLAREMAEIKAQLEENFGPLRDRGHSIQGGLQPILTRVERIEKTLAPLAQEIAAVKQIRKGLDDELSAMKSLSRSVKLALGILGAPLLGLGIWVVTTTRDLQDETAQHGTQIETVRTSQREIQADAQGTRDAVAALVVRIERADARDAERWEGVRATLERLEKRRR